jgi:hypothetical protein
MLKIRRLRKYKRLLGSRLDRLWRWYSGKDDYLYFGVVYKARVGEREFEETGVVSARTVEQAVRKADLARKVIEGPEPEEQCGFSLVPISIRGYRLLRRHRFDIDSFFDEDDNLRV